MNKANLAKAIVEKTKPLRKRLYVWQIIVIFIICVIATIFLVKVIDKKAEADKYLQTDITNLSKYDPNMIHKVYVPLAQKGGISVTLGKTSFDRYWDVVLCGKYIVKFIKASEEIGRTEVSSTIEIVEGKEKMISNLVMECPENVIQSGYDTIIFIPVSGKNYSLSYLTPIAEPEDSVALQPAKEQEFTAYVFNGINKETGTQEDVQGLFAFMVSIDNSNMVLEVESTNSILNINLLSVLNANGETVANFRKDTLLPAYTEVSENITYELPIVSTDYEVNDLYLCYQYEESNIIKKQKINPFMPENDEIYNNTLIRTKDNMSEFPMINENNDIVTLEGDYVVLDKPLYIPKGKEFHLKAGQTVDMTNNSFIVSRSPLFVEGTEKEPVLFTSTDNSKSAGLAVIEAGNRSKINYLICDNLGEVSSGIWHLTGAVTFYESDVDMFYCQFINNRSEDGLNIVKSDTTVNNCTIKNTYQDAFDSDFSTGVFDGCHFEGTGNDGFDVSTSTFTVKNTTFKNIHDKAISAGERSTVTLENIITDYVQIGIGAKDSSKVFATNVTIKNALIGFCSYQKKPEFGPSQITVNQYSLSGTMDFKYLIEKQDQLFVNGKQWQATNKKKESIIIERMINEEPIK